MRAKTSDFIPCFLILLGAAAVHLSLVRVGWHNPLLDGHEFRQTQTALTTYWIKQEGWQMPPPLPLFGPPWAAPLEFPFYQGIVAWLSHISHRPLEGVGRLVSLGFFYLSLPAMYLLGARLNLKSGHRLLLPALALVTPVYAFYSRSFGIESSAFCFGIWFLWLADYCLHSPRVNGLTWFGLLLLGMLTALAKITTFASFLAPIAVLMFTRVRAREYHRLMAVGLAIAVALGVGYAWIRYGDGIKAPNPFASFLTSSASRAWSFGDWATRTDLSYWNRLITTTSEVLLLKGNLLLVAVIGLTAPVRTRRVIVGLVFSFVASPLVFANLYLIHDYYFYAPGVLMLAALVLCWARLLEITQTRRWTGWLVLIVSLSLQGWGFHQGLFRLQQRVTFLIPPEAELLKLSTDPDEAIVVVGQDWNPIVPYYAQRKTIMMREGVATEISNLNEVLSRSALPVGAMLIEGGAPEDLARESLLSQALGLQTRPSLSASNQRIFLSPRRTRELGSRLASEKLGGFVMNEIMDSDVPGISWQRFEGGEIEDQVILEPMIPRPDEIFAPFGLSGAIFEGARVFNAHAPTDIVFSPSPDATTVELEYGLNPEAYKPGNQGDGVLFRLDHWEADGTRHTLWQRHLDPLRRPEDRGTHMTKIPLPASGGGRLVARVMAGESDNIQFDWAYWRKIETR